MTDDLDKSVVTLHIEWLQKQLAAMTARALRAESIEREVCEGRHVYLQQEMDEMAQRALKAEAHAATLIEALQYVRPYCKAKYGMPEDIEERLDAAIYQRSI